MAFSGEFYNPALVALFMSNEITKRKMTYGRGYLTRCPNMKTTSMAPSAYDNITNQPRASLLLDAARQEVELRYHSLPISRL
jgi:hypothetical protein